MSISGSLTFAQGTVPIGAVLPLSPAVKLSVGTYLCVAVTSYTQCAAVSTCRGLTRAPVHHSYAPALDARAFSCPVVRRQSL